MKRKQHRVELSQKGKGEPKAKREKKTRNGYNFKITWVHHVSKSIKGEASSPIHTDRDLQPAVSSSISEVNESFEEILFR